MLPSYPQLLTGAIAGRRPPGEGGAWAREVWPRCKRGGVWARGKYCLGRGLGAGGGRGVRWGGARGRGLDTGEVWARGRGVACREQVWVCKGGGGVCPRLPPSAGSDVPHYFRFRRRHADRRPLGSFPPALRGPARSGSSRHHLGAAGAAGGAWGERGDCSGTGREPGRWVSDLGGVGVDGSRS